MARKTNRLSSNTMMTPEEENHLVSLILPARELWVKEEGTLTDDEKKTLRVALDATHKLVTGYAPLIEKIAKERYAGVPAHRADLDDFISEAYIVAYQCARTFNPTLGSKPIRFSSYFPRAISSSLSRMAMRSRSIVSVPISKMTDARKWSHTRFEMENLGIELTDEDISEISGVKSTQQEVMGILGVTSEDNIDDVDPPGVVDDITENVKKDYDQLVSAIQQSCSKYYGTGLLYLMGLATGEALTTRFLLSVEIQPHYDHDYDVENFLETYPGYVYHPIVRMRLREKLNNKKGKSHG